MHLLISLFCLFSRKHIAPIHPRYSKHGQPMTFHELSFPALFFSHRPGDRS